MINPRHKLNHSTTNYLALYVDQLNMVPQPHLVHGQLSDWHFMTRPDLDLAVTDLNASLGLAGPYALQPHIATTAAGRLDGRFVIVSANPGFSDRPLVRNPERRSKNAMENGWRSADREQNTGFCRHFFGTYRQVCGGSSPYWTRVMRFLQVYNGTVGLSPAASGPELWDRAATDDELGGVDLLPFHSTSDGVTPYLYGPRAVRELREVALATLAMALRHRPEFLLVTSYPGQILICDLMDELVKRPHGSHPPGATDIVPCPVSAGHGLWDRIRAWTVNGGATTVVTFPYQIFSGSFPATKVGYSHAGFAAALRRLRS